MLLPAPSTVTAQPSPPAHCPNRSCAARSSAVSASRVIPCQQLVLDEQRSQGETGGCQQSAGANVTIEQAQDTEHLGVARGECPSSREGPLAGEDDVLEQHHLSLGVQIPVKLR